MKGESSFIWKIRLDFEILAKKQVFICTVDISEELTNCKTYHYIYYYTLGSSCSFTSFTVALENIHGIKSTKSCYRHLNPKLFCLDIVDKAARKQSESAQISADLRSCVAVTGCSHNLCIILMILTAGLGKIFLGCLFLSQQNNLISSWQMPILVLAAS